MGQRTTPSAAQFRRRHATRMVRSDIRCILRFSRALDADYALCTMAVRLVAKNIAEIGSTELLE
jgi:hypothetical protein